MKKQIYDTRQLPVWLSVEQTAMLLGISAYTVRKFCREGKIKGQKVGKRLWRINKDEVLNS